MCTSGITSASSNSAAESEPRLCFAGKENPGQQPRFAADVFPCDGCLVSTLNCANVSVEGGSVQVECLSRLYIKDRENPDAHHSFGRPSRRLYRIVL
jgi:hypothetical protein